MPLLNIHKTGLPLGSFQSSSKPDAAIPQVFSLALSDDLIEDMIKCVRNGKEISLSLGKDPKITYDTNIQNLTSTNDPFYSEYFRTSLSPPSPSTASTVANSLPNNAMPYPTNFWGWGAAKRFSPQIRTVRLSDPSKGTSAVAKANSKKKATGTISKAAPKINVHEPSPMEGTDAALAALKSSLASEDARKKDNTTKHVKDTSTLPPAVQQRGSAQPIKASNKNRFLHSNKKSLGSGATRSMPTSPALTGVGSPSLAPTSAPKTASEQQAEQTKALRRPIIHQLAIGPATEEHIFRFKPSNFTAQELKLALEKVAELEDGKWKLKQRFFNDLDVFSYKNYTSDERQLAIENAIRAYDRLRLNASEPQWDKLLPLEERGTGKCLSKLQAKIAVGAIQPAKIPKVRVHGAEDSGRDTAAEDNDDDLFGDKKPTALKAEEMTRSHSNPPTTKPKKVSEKEVQAKRMLAKTGGKVITGRVTKSSAVKSSEKKTSEKESKKIKSSKFVSESDEEEDSYLMATKPTPAVTAKNNTARKPLPKPMAVKAARDESDPKAVTTKPKGNSTSPQKSSPLASTPPTNASDIEDSSSSSVIKNLKRKSTDSSSDVPIKRHQKSSSSSTNSSITSSNGIGSGGRRMGRDWADRTSHHSLTLKYNSYYPIYRQFYEDVERSWPRDQDKLADLREMSERLRKWKVEIMSTST